MKRSEDFKDRYVDKHQNETILDDADCSESPEQDCANNLCDPLYQANEKGQCKTDDVQM